MARYDGRENAVTRDDGKRVVPFGRGYLVLGEQNVIEETASFCGDAIFPDEDDEEDDARAQFGFQHLADEVQEAAEAAMEALSLIHI